MREIGSIAQESDAKVLADYLLTLNITTKIEPNAGVWAVWVHREDKVAQARIVLAEFQANPADPRFHAVAKTAKEIRKQAEKVEREYRKRTRDFRERWEGAMYHRAPLAFALIIVSVVVTALMNVSMLTDSWVLEFLTFSTKAITKDEQVRDTGFNAILHGQVWRAITPIFIHFGLPHLFFNMIAMRYLGEKVEMRKGTLKFGLLVLVAAITSNCGESLMTKGDTVNEQMRIFGGMSGVIFALAGYLWTKGHTDPGDYLTLDQRSANWMFGWFLLGIIAPMTVSPEMRIGFPYNMANVAHGVGLATGVIFGLLRF